MEGTFFRCCVGPCDSVAPTLRELISHMRRMHENERDCRLTCNIDNCQQFFSSVRTYRRHVSRIHSARWNDVRTRSNIENTSSEESAFDLNQSNEHLFSAGCGMEFEDSLSVCQDQLNAPSLYDDFMMWVSEQFVSFKLKLKHKYKLTNTAVSCVMDDLGDFLKTFKFKYDACVKCQLDSEPVAKEYLNFMLSDSISIDTAVHLTASTEEKIMHKLGYVKPQQIEIVNAKGKKQYIHYVPVHDTLKSYLQHDDVLYSIGRECLKPDVIDKLSAGTVMNDHPVFMNDPSAIRLVFYTDEFEVCTPVGAHTKKHKICAVYFSVNNIESKYASALCSIHLALLVKYDIVKEQGYETAFQQLLSDLVLMEKEGISLEVNGIQKHFNVGVAAMLGDNLSQHSLGGFRMCFSSGRVCRHCMVLYCDLANISSESECMLRTVESHDIHVSCVLADPKLKSVYGVNGPSAFRTVPSFHPVDYLPPDIMHDVYESFMPINVTVVIRGLVCGKIITISEVNTILSQFPYGKNDKVNCISILPSNFTSPNVMMQGTAAEKWHFFQMLTLVLGPHIPENNVYWKLHLTACSICDILLAPALLDGWISELVVLVKVYFTMWNELPEEIVGKVKPKLHFLIHFPRMLEKFGPLRLLNCMRYEAFHLFFKQVAKITNNYINITKTLSTKFQGKRCMEYSGRTALPVDEVLGKQKTVTLKSLSEDAQAVISSYLDVENDAVLLIANRVITDGQKLSTDDCVVIDILEDFPLFFKIHHILMHSGLWTLYGVMIHPTKWCEHLHAFEVSMVHDIRDWICIKPSQVIPMQVLDVYDINSRNFIKLRHRPLC